MILRNLHTQSSALPSRSNNHTYFSSSRSCPKSTLSRNVAFLIHAVCGTYAMVPPKTTYTHRTGKNLRYAYG